jgi:hypothetical protein
MSAAAVGVALLPGPGDPDKTLASVRAEAGPDVPILTLTEGGGERLRASAETIAFARAGDRWREGTLAARLRPLIAHPNAMLAVAAHVLVDSDGNEVLTVAAPPLPVDPAELLLRAAVEPAAVLVRASALDESSLALLLCPHGDRVVWSRLVRKSGIVRSGEVAAEVLLDPNRHGSHPEQHTQTLLAAVVQAEAVGTDAPVSAMRRDVLRRLYLGADPAPEPIDLTVLLGPGPAVGDRAAAVVADLQWALERARETLAAERVSWPPGVERDDDAPGLFVEEELLDLRAAVRKMMTEVEERDALLRHYEAEIRRRDATISRLAQPGAVAVAVAAERADGPIA